MHSSQVAPAVPAAHGEQLALPTGEVFPVSQLVQLCFSALLVNVFNAQFLHADKPN